MSDPLRILVLTSSTGGGHDARAQAFRDWSRLLYGPQVEVRIEQMLEKSSRVHAAGVGFYNGIQRRAPWMHHAFFALVESLGVLNRRTVTLGRAYYLKVLREFRPNLVLSVHDCLNRGYFALAKRELGPRARCATYCGEFSGGYGFSRNWVAPEVDAFFARTPTAADYAVEVLGLARPKVKVRGHFLPPRSSSKPLSPAERRTYRQQVLGLDPDRFTLLLATGGTGANNHLELAPELAGFSRTLQVIFMCGRDGQTRERLETWSRRTPGLRCAVLPFTDEPHLLMQASDAIFTRGGTTTCAKALHFGCPLILNAFGGVMPQERLTLKYFLSGHGAVRVRDTREFVRVLERWRDEAGLYDSIRRNLLALRYPGRTEDVIRDLVDLAEAAAGVQVREAPGWRAGLSATESWLQVRRPA